MSPGRVVLHVGGAKVGSSSLQTALTAQPSGTGIEYLVWRADGSFDRLSPHGVDEHHNPFGYAVSAFTLTDLADWTSVDVSRARSTLLRAARKGTVVLSSEFWGRQAVALAQSPRACQRLSELLGGDDLEPEIVLYVRPPAPWLESAYLQFGIWTGTDLPSWAAFLAHEQDAFWNLRAESLERVAPVNVRCVPNVVDDFFVHVLGLAQADHEVVANPRIGLDLLALLLRRPDLRPDWAGSAVEFLLGREADRLGLQQRPVPPLLGADLVNQVEAAHADDVALLLQRLSPEHAATFEASARDFAEERRGIATITREQVRDWTPDPDFVTQLLTKDVVARIHELASAPDTAAVLRPQDRGAPTNWRNRGEGHWLSKARSSDVALRLVPRESRVARWLGAVADRVL